jgi:SAM-dependent methyltransferase
MKDPYSGNLRLWEGWQTSVLQDPRPSPSGRILPGPHNPAEFADRLYAYESLNPTAASPNADEGAEPYTLQWFLNIENTRHSRHGRWIPRLLEFAKHSGETLLGLGNGLGTDWLQYARHGAHVVVCSPSAVQLELIRRNFELRGLGGRFLHATPTSLPLDNATIDVVCVSSLLHEAEDTRAVINEIYRVLKPGGKVLAVAPARYDVDFWFPGLPWRRWLRGRAEAERPATRYRRRGLRRLFSPFVEHRIHQRQLRRSETPFILRCLPMSLLERLMGRALVLKAFKPLSAAIAAHVAA